MRIDPGVFMIASGQHGIDLTDPHDCNCYLFDAGGSYVVFDSGAGVDPDAILRVLKEDGLDQERPYHLFLTHGHADHSGGGGILKDYLELEVYGSAGTAVRTENGGSTISLLGAVRAGVYPPAYRFRRYEVDHVLEDGQSLNFGEVGLSVYFTPGHSDDHVCYLAELHRRKYLVSGDAVFHGGGIILQNTYDCRVPETIESIQRLAELDFEALLPGHNLFSLKNGKQHLEKAGELIGRMGCPPSII